jgi:hypothetical protein
MPITMSAGGAWLWFLSCYSPLFFLISIRALAVHNSPFAVLCLAIGVVSIASAWVSMRLADPPTTVTVAAVRVHDTDVPAYLVTYVVPFVGVTGEGWLDGLVLAIVLGLVGMFYVQSSLSLPNPTVQVFGYRWLSLDVDGKSLNVLASGPQRRRLIADSVAIGAPQPRTVSLRHIGSQIWLIHDA